MRYRLLGNLAVERDDGVAVEIAAPKRRALLAILLLQRSRPITRERLIELLWGDEPPDTAEDSLFAHVSRLRRDIGKDRIRSVPGGYVLAVADDELDVARFERDVEAGRRALASRRWQEASSVLGEALDRWHGTALAEFSSERFALPEIRRLEQLRDAAVEDRLDAELELGLHTTAVAELERLVKEHPLRERLWAQLMLALYRCGRQSDALDRYRELRSTLVRDLGIEPSPALHRLQGRILRQDPALLLASTAAFDTDGAIAAEPAMEPVLQEVPPRDRRGGPSRLVAPLGVGGIASLVVIAGAVLLQDRQPGASSAPSGVGATPNTVAATPEIVERILFSAASPPDEFLSCDTLETRLMLVDPAGGNPIRVTKGGDTFELNGRWSPDATKIAFMGGDHDGTSLFVMSADGTGLRDLLPSRPPVDIPDREQGVNWLNPLFHPSWTSDGAAIVFTYGQGGVWVVRPDGTGLEQRIPEPNYHPDDVGYSFRSTTALPDGRIGVELAEPDTGDIARQPLYIANADGSGFGRLPGLPDDVIVEGSAWSAAGRLAFRGVTWTSIEDAPVAHVYVVDSPGGAPRLIEGTTGVQGPPAWSPDGTRLAFDAGGALHTIRPDGTERKTVVADPDFTVCGASWVRTTANLLPRPPEALGPGESAPPAAFHRGFLDPGIYSTSLFEPRLRFTLGPGWSGNRNAADSIRIDYGWGTEQGFSGNIVVGRSQVVATSACPGGEGQLIGPTAAEFIDYLVDHPHDPTLEVSAPYPVIVGGQGGLGVDVFVTRASTMEECPGAPPPFLNMHPMFEVGGRTIVVRSGDRIRIVSVDVERGAAVTFFLIAPTQDFESYTPVTPEEFEAFLDVAQPVLDSLAFE